MQPKTYDQIATEYERAGKGKPRRCPKCGQGALLLLSNIEAGQDGEIYERSYICSWCGKEHHESRNPYLEQ